MSRGLDMQYNEENNVIVILKKNSQLGLKHLVPVDGKEHTVTSIGLSVDDLQHEEDGKLLGLDGAIKVRVNKPKGTICATRLVPAENTIPCRAVSNILCFINGFEKLSTAEQLIAVRTALSEAPKKVLYVDLVENLSKFNLTGHLRSIILTHHKYIDFHNDGEPPVKASNGSLVIQCEKKSPLRSIEFIACTDGSGVNVYVERESRTLTPLVVDGASKHLVDFGLTVADIVHYLPANPYLQSGIYFIELGNDVVVTINCLGIIRAISSEQLSNPVPEFTVTNDCAIHQVGKHLTSRQDAVSLLTYGLLASFNKTSLSSLLHTLECYSAHDYSEEVLKTIRRE